MICLAAMVHEPLYHASARLSDISWLLFNKTIIPLALVGYETIIANLYPTRARGGGGGGGDYPTNALAPSLS